MASVKRSSSVDVEAAVLLADTAVFDRYTTYLSPNRLSRGCIPWMGALSGAGHGRFWLGTRSDGRDLVMVAHRVGFAFNFGVDVLQASQAVRHRCDEPSCQEASHWLAGTIQENTIEWSARRHIPGSPLRDIRGPRGRAEALRHAARNNLNLDAVAMAGTPVGDFLQSPMF